jgi:pyrroline-5-carboxylate reductase
VSRAVPLPSVARHLGPILLHPDDHRVFELFDTIGRTIAVPDEHQLNVLWALTALIAPFYGLIDELCQWTEASGVDRKIAGPYITSMFHAISDLAADVPGGDFSGLMAKAATRGGLNEQALSEIRKQDGYQAFLDALDSVMVRLRERVPERNEAKC